jgi:pimeloyl-ACP methyl ester carboxylesterase
MMTEAKMILQVLKRLAKFLVGLLSLSLLGLQAYKIILRIATRIEAPNGISSLEEIELGGLRQWIFIRGEDRNHPILIFLHGGPGAPLFGISSARTLYAELIKHFTVVHWDQRGAGKSYRRDIPVKSLTFDRLVEDCNELIDYTRDRFNAQKVFIVGHSWGSVIGIQTAYKYPEKIHAFVGVSQIISNHEKLAVSYDFVVDGAENSRDAGRLNTLKEIGPPPFDTLEELKVLNSYISHYGGVMRNKGLEQMIAMLGFLTSPEYSLTEGLNAMRLKGMDFTIRALWDEMEDIDVAEEIRSIEVPIYFFESKFDMANPTVIVEDFYNNLEDREDKHLVIFEGSAHFPMIEEREKYQDLLVSVASKESQGESPNSEGVSYVRP